MCAVPLLLYYYYIRIMGILYFGVYDGWAESERKYIYTYVRAERRGVIIKSSRPHAAVPRRVSESPVRVFKRVLYEPARSFVINHSKNGRRYRGIRLRVGTRTIYIPFMYTRVYVYDCVCVRVYVRV